MNRNVVVTASCTQTGDATIITPTDARYLSAQDRLAWCTRCVKFYHPINDATLDTVRFYHRTKNLPITLNR